MIFVIQILVGAISALVLGGIAYLIFKDHKKKSFKIFIAGGTAVVLSVSNQTIIPKYESWSQRRELRDELLKIEMYSEIKKADEETYQEIENQLFEVTKNGSNLSQAMAQAQQLIMGSFSKYVPTSTNGAVRSFMVANLNAISHLCADDLQYCYEYTYGSGASKLGITKRLTKETQSALMNTIGKVIVDSKKNPQPAIDSLTCQANMEKMVKDAYEEYGEDVLLVTEPGQPGIDIKKLMDATENIYKVIFKYPENEGGEILRCMLSSI